MHDSVAELFAAYAAANDVRDVDLVGECFTADGAFTLHVAGADTVGPLAPRRELVAFFAEAFSAQDDQRRRVITNVRHLVIGDEAARVEAYLLLVVTDRGRTAVKSAGRYDAQLGREGDGWRFRDLTLFLDSPF